MKKFKVVLTEELKYNLEVEAETEEQAVDVALSHHKFTDSLSDDRDTTWEIHEVKEETN